MSSRYSKNELFTEAFNNFYPLVFSTVYTKVGNYDEAEDICQEIFMRFFKKFDEVINFRKWLYGTLRNVLLEYYRNKSKEKIDEYTLIDDVSLSFVNGFNDTRLVIEEALNELDKLDDKRSRSLFELVAINSFTYKQAGKQLGLSERQVRYKYGLIVQIIIQFLRKKGIKNLEELL